MNTFAPHPAIRRSALLITLALAAALLARAISERKARRRRLIPSDANLGSEGFWWQVPCHLDDIEHHDFAISRSLLSQFLDLGNSATGSRALGEAFVSFFQMAIQGVLEEIADTATAHIVEDLVDLNFGEDERAPVIRPGDIGGTPEVLADSVAQLINVGAITPDEELENWLRRAMRLPLRTETTPKVREIPEPGDEEESGRPFELARWDEGEHPRDRRGRFNSKGDQGEGVPLVRSATSWLARVDSAHSLLHSSIARNRGFDSVDDFRAAVTARVKDMVQRPELRVRMRSDKLLPMLREGRYKSQFETGTSGGAYLPRLRASAEELLFGYSADLSLNERPVYAYLSEHPPGYAEGPVDHYGGVVIVLKPQVRSRATVVGDDSLRIVNAGQDSAPVPVSDPDWHFFDRRRIQGVLNRPPNAMLDDSVIGYAEAQIHGGGFGPEDIARVVFEYPPSPELASELERLGIAWGLYES